LFGSTPYSIMKMKHILVAGALVLVVIGCVLAAGCTSTTNNGLNPASGLIVVEENTEELYQTMPLYSSESELGEKIQPASASEATGAAVEMGAVNSKKSKEVQLLLKEARSVVSSKKLGDNLGKRIRGLIVNVEKNPDNRLYIIELRSALHEAQHVKIAEPKPATGYIVELETEDETFTSGYKTSLHKNTSGISLDIEEINRIAIPK